MPADRHESFSGVWKTTAPKSGEGPPPRARGKGPDPPLNFLEVWAPPVSAGTLEALRRASKAMGLEFEVEGE